MAKAHPAHVGTGRILIAIDGSPAALAAVEAGLDIASCARAHVTFLHANSPLAEELAQAYPLGGPPRDVILAHDSVLQDAADQALSRGVQADVELISSAHARPADLADEMAGIATGIGASLIVVGSRGVGAVAGAVLGSVSHDLIRWATVPVLVAHAPTLPEGEGSGSREL